ncbi:MAG: hypothetical protein H0V20_09255 [Actinobacteria bacterium]|nr:hypothetical protein [Actinomycetota bacterium]
MGLLDWLRGGKQAEEPGHGDSVDERLEARRQDQSGTTPDPGVESADPALQRRDEEAARHSGI